MQTLMEINTWANRCGYFYNANFDPDAASCPNNGYNCRHPDCEETSDGIGCCFSWACPLALYTADCNDCKAFGAECSCFDENCEESLAHEACDLVVVEIPEDRFRDHSMYKKTSVSKAPH